MSKVRILVVDDERNILVTLSRALSLAGYEAILAESAEEGLEKLLAGTVEIVILDVKLPAMDGLTALAEIKRRNPEIPVVMMSGHGSIETAVRAVRLGAFDFVEKPLASEKVLVTIENALRMGALAKENRELKRTLGRRYEIVGTSRPLEELLDRVRRAAHSNAPVLILGENGTGKELIARAIYETSPRSSGPFVKVNCAAVPTELIESELFGHEKGAFTSAIRSRKGKFEMADGGTLFMDEIGDMKPEMQAKLLRVLQEGEFERVGGSGVVRVDVRVLAATNKNLEAEVTRGTFRQDLYYRVNVLPLVVPPLRDRASDIAQLAQHFLELAAEDHDKRLKTLTAEAMDRLRGYHWPGNVRELKNIIERLVILCPDDAVTEDDVISVLPTTRQAMASPESAPPPTVSAGNGRSLKDQVSEAERTILVRTLREHRWHVSNASRALGIERSHLYKKMRQYDISRED